MEDQTAKQRLIHYLLGGLQVEERRRIEERYFDDEAFFQEMLIIEEELIDSFVNHDLSDEEAERFEKYYLTTPERRVQVEFARVLAASLQKVKGLGAPEEAHSPPPPVRASRLAASRERYRSLGWRLIAAPAAIAVLLLAITGLWLRHQASRLEQERTRLSQQRQETDRLNEQLERDLKHLEQVRKRVESLTVAPSGDTKISIGMLFPILTRSGPGGQVLQISAQATLLLLQAPVESAGKTYQAVLTRDGAEVMRLNHAAPRSAQGGNIIEIPLSATMLNGGSYALTVKPEDGEEGTDIYSFEIQKR